MKNATYILFILGLLLSSCESNSVRETENETFVVNELFLLRTEGMALCEIAAANNPSLEIQAACEKLRTYYTATQEEFVYLCNGRSVAVGSEDFDIIWRHIDGHLSKDSSQFEIAFIELSSDNILRSIALHELILQRQDWEDIMYYAFKSLPELYKQQGALAQLKESRYVKRKPEAVEVEAVEVKTATLAL